MYAFKECSSCGALYNKDHCCSIDTFVRDPNETPDSSKQSLLNCPKCGDPVDGLVCRPCAFIRKCLNEVCFTSCDENESFKNLLNPPQQTQTHSSESSNDNTNFVDTPQEPIVENQDPSENFAQNSSQSPPQITQNCCYGCGDSLDGFFCQRCTYESCGNGAHYGYNCPPQVLIISNPEPCYNQNFDEFPQTSPITPVLLTEEPVISLIMEDEHLDTIAATESDEVIKSSVEELIPIPSESKGIPDKMCDVPFCDNPSPLEAFKEHYEIVVNSNNDSTSSDDDSPYGEDIDYVDASPPDSKLVSLEVVEIVIPKVGGIDIDILQTIKDDILHEKLLNSSSTFPNSFLEETNTFDNSIPESETFCFDLEENSSGSTTTRSDYSLPDYEAFYLDDDHIEEKSSGSTTTHADFSQYDSFIFDLSINPFPPADRSDFYHEEFAGELAHIISPSEYDHFYFKIEPELGNFTMDVVEDIFDNPTREPRVHVPNVLPTHPTLHLDSDFTISSDSLGSDLVVSFPSGTRNKIFDPGIFIRVQSKIFLSRDAFSISFIRDPLFPVIDTLLPFSSENEDKVVNTGILAAGEEQSPHLSSHRGLKALNESPMMIHGENTPNLGVRHLHFYPP
ncbi:hypothetical protein Tco_1122463 [Tanacetum coccineum]|uniref:Uncharacterized protein n=1 Tax=Tanacetum coccineum TaxID=301880 RepID=A0ABQ5J3K4_9ASTR